MNQQVIPGPTGDSRQHMNQQVIPGPTGDSKPILERLLCVTNSF